MRGPVADALPAVFADDVLGLERGALVVAEPDRRWPVAFHRLAALLLPALPEGVVAVEHVGSTAVPGLPAKPILDVAVGVGSTTDAAAADQALQEFGFLRRGEEDGPDLNRNFGLELVPRIRLVNAHLVVFGARPWRDYLTFRDRLRADPVARDAYAELKRGLAVTHAGNRPRYVEAKTAHVTAVVARPQG